MLALQIFRVARFEPEDEDREPVLFVFQRIEDAEDEEDEQEEEVSRPRAVGRKIGLTWEAASSSQQNPAGHAVRIEMLLCRLCGLVAWLGHIGKLAPEWLSLTT